jgi:hypothetical protein
MGEDCSLCSNIVIELHYVRYENYEIVDYFVVKAC